MFFIIIDPHPSGPLLNLWHVTIFHPLDRQNPPAPVFNAHRIFIQTPELLGRIYLPGSLCLSPTPRAVTFPYSSSCLWESPEHSPWHRDRINKTICWLCESQGLSLVGFKAREKERRLCPVLATCLSLTLISCCPLSFFPPCGGLWKPANSPQAAWPDL